MQAKAHGAQLINERYGKGDGEEKIILKDNSKTVQGKKKQGTCKNPASLSA